MGARKGIWLCFINEPWSAIVGRFLSNIMQRTSRDHMCTDAFTWLDLSGKKSINKNRVRVSSSIGEFANTALESDVQSTEHVRLFIIVCCGGMFSVCFPFYSGFTELSHRGIERPMCCGDLKWQELMKSQKNWPVHEPVIPRVSGKMEVLVQSLFQDFMINV